MTPEQEREAVVACKNCRFGVLKKGIFDGRYKYPDHVLCHFYPDTKEVNVRHWCGQFQSGQHLKGEQ